MQVEACEGAFAQADAWVGEVVGHWKRGCNELAEECRDVGIVADDEKVFVGGALTQQALELGEGRGGSQAFGHEDAGLVAGFGADELRGLHAALERAGDDEVEVELHRGEDVSEMQAVALAVFIERTLGVEDGIDAAGAGAGVAKDVEVHAFSGAPLPGCFGCWGS